MLLKIKYTGEDKKLNMRLAHTAPAKELRRSAAAYMRSHIRSPQAASLSARSHFYYLQTFPAKERL